MKTGKGSFKFVKVSDGVFVQHEWGSNSGQIGIPINAIAAFIEALSSVAGKGGGTANGRAQQGARPAAKPAAKQLAGIAKKEPVERKKKEAKKEPTLEELDADLTSYLAGKVKYEEMAEAPPATV